MANIVTPSETECQEWQEWLQSRAPDIRAVAARFSPWALYRLKPTGQYVTFRGVSYDEKVPRTLTVDVVVEPKYNPAEVCAIDGCNHPPMRYLVSRLDPSDLEEAELPILPS